MALLFRGRPQRLPARGYRQVRAQPGRASPRRPPGWPGGHGDHDGVVDPRVRNRRDRGHGAEPGPDGRDHWRRRFPALRGLSRRMTAALGFRMLDIPFSRTIGAPASGGPELSVPTAVGLERGDETLIK